MIISFLAIFVISLKAQILDPFQNNPITGIPIDQTPARKSCPDGYQQLGKQCARMVQVEPQYNCANGGTLQADGTCIRRFAKNSECAAGFVRDGGVCVRIRTAPRQIVCGEGYSLRTDNTCVKLEQLPDKDACPVGSEAKGSTCVIHTLESPTLDCPEGFQLQGRACVIEETYDCTPAHPVASRAGFSESKNLVVNDAVIAPESPQDTVTGEANFVGQSNDVVQQLTETLNSSNGNSLVIIDDSTQFIDNGSFSANFVDEIEIENSDNAPVDFRSSINNAQQSPRSQDTQSTNVESQPVSFSTESSDFASQSAQNSFSTQNSRFNDNNDNTQNSAPAYPNQFFSTMLMTMAPRQSNTNQQSFATNSRSQNFVPQVGFNLRSSNVQNNSTLPSRSNTNNNADSSTQTTTFSSEIILSPLQQLQQQQSRYFNRNNNSVVASQNDQQQQQQSSNSSNERTVSQESQQQQQIISAENMLAQITSPQRASNGNVQTVAPSPKLPLIDFVDRPSNIVAFDGQRLSMMSRRLQQKKQGYNNFFGNTLYNDMNGQSFRNSGRFNANAQNYNGFGNWQYPGTQQTYTQQVSGAQQQSGQDSSRTNNLSQPQQNAAQQQFFSGNQISSENQVSVAENFLQNSTFNNSSLGTNLVTQEQVTNQQQTQSTRTNSNQNITTPQPLGNQALSLNQGTLLTSEISSRFSSNGILADGQILDTFTQATVIDDYIAASTCRRIRMQPATKICRQGVLDGKMCRVDSYIQPIRTFGGVAEEVVPSIPVCPLGYSPSQESPDNCIVQDEMLPTFFCATGSRDTGDDCVVIQNSIATCDTGFALEGNVCVQTQFVPQTVEYTVTFACVGKECT